MIRPKGLTFKDAFGMNVFFLGLLKQFLYVLWHDMDFVDQNRPKWVPS